MIGNDQIIFVMLELSEYIIGGVWFFFKESPFVVQNKSKKFFCIKINTKIIIKKKV